ncbi:MAG: hypothetical protein WCO71_10720, partial [Pseudomonadota bacterium]
MDNSTQHSDCLNDPASATDSAQLLYYYRTLLDTPPPSSSSPENNHPTPSNDTQDPVDDKPIANATTGKRKILDYVIKGETDKATTSLDGEPTHADHNHLRFNAEEILKPISVKGARDRYSLNWLNVAELLANKECLDPRAQDLLHSFVKSKWDTVSWLEN